VVSIFIDGVRVEGTPESEAPPPEGAAAPSEAETPAGVGEATAGTGAAFPAQPEARPSREGPAPTREAPAPESEPRPEDEQERLRATAGAVGLELRRAELLSRAAPGGEVAPEVRTACAEACILRVLRLRGFFYGPGGDPRRPVAADYFDDPAEWAEVRPVRTALLDEWLEDLRAYVEPALDREAERRVPEGSWPLAGFVAAMEVAFQALVEALPPERGIWFARRAAL